MAASARVLATHSPDTYGPDHKSEVDDDDPTNLLHRFKATPDRTKVVTMTTLADYLVDWVYYF